MPYMFKHEEQTESAVPQTVAKIIETLGVTSESGIYKALNDGGTITPGYVVSITASLESDSNHPRIFRLFRSAASAGDPVTVVYESGIAGIKAIES